MLRSNSRHSAEGGNASWVETTARPPAARCRPSTAWNRAAWSASERGCRLVRQPQRGVAGDQPRQRHAALLPGGQETDRRVCQTVQIQCRDGRLKSVRPCSLAMKRKASRGVSVVRSASRWPSHARLRRQAMPSSAIAVPFSSMVPAAGRNNPASIRNRLDLPAPFGPRTISACPAASVKERSAKTMRSPRTQAKPETARKPKAALVGTRGDTVA